MNPEDLEVHHYIIGGGAEQSAEQARRLLYGHQQGAEGVCEPGDLRVLPTVVAGGFVRVVIGSTFITSRAQGAIREMYFGSVTAEQIIEIPANETTSARTDLIVMRVKDPYTADGHRWADPGAGLDDGAAELARARAQYVFIERIPSVPAGTTRLQNVPGYENDTAYTLGRVTLPAMTGTVITAHITDLRALHTPRRDYFVYARPRIGSDGGTQQYLTGKDSLGGEYFPGGGGSPNQFTAYIPPWATRMVIDAKWITVLMTGNPWGSQWIEYGTEYRNRGWVLGQDYEFATQKFGWHSPATSDMKSTNFLVMDEVPIPAKLRGKTVTFVFKASRRDEAQINSSNQVSMLWDSGLGCRVDYAQSALDADMI